LLDTYNASILIGGVTTVLSVLMSAFLIRQHFTNWINPRQQRLICYIIAMVPLFAVDSFLGLLEADASETFVMVLDSIKECYEAFVIASFLDLMYAQLGLDPEKEVQGELKGRHVHLIFPFSLFMKEMHLDKKSLRTMRSWTTQFVYLRPLISIISLGLQVAGKLDKVYTLISIVLNISVTLAVTSLMIFYHSFDKELAPHRPLAKFLCIKGVVFFIFWQSVVLEALVYFKVVHEGHWWTTDEVSTAIQNFLVCLEMGLLFSFAHFYAFDPKNVPAAAEAGKKAK